MVNPCDGVTGDAPNFVVDPVAGVDCISPAEDPLWLSLLDHPAAGLFHSPPWLCALSETYGFRVRAYVARTAAGSAAGGIPFCEVEDILGPRIVALPFSDTCDPLLASCEAWDVLLERLQSHGLPVYLRFLDARPVLAGDHWRTVKTVPSQRVTIASSLEELWAGLTAPTRRAINKARRAGLQVRPLGRHEVAEGFYRLHVALRKNKYRMLAQSQEFFEALADRFAACGAWFPLGAFLDGRLVAAALYLRWRQTLYYKFNASAQDALALRPNNLLVWTGLELAQSLGCNVVDLGPSDEDQPGLIRFKRGFGAVPQEARFLMWNPPGWRDTTGAPARAMLSEITELLTAPEVPDEVTAKAGACLYRFFA
jgi:CelD/BcsL family acetyltransferase involved in cellulose biosynthesis